MEYHTVTTQAQAEALTQAIREEGMRAYWLKLAEGRYQVREFF